jgi:acetoin utilization protein AcuB
MIAAAPSMATYMTRSPHGIGVDQSLSTARSFMKKHEVRHLPVLSGGELVGVVSERDVALIDALSDADPERVSVEEAMSPSTYSVSPDTPLEEIARTMAEHKYGCAVAMKEGRVVGILTIVDVCRALAELLHGRRGSAS